METKQTNNMENQTENLTKQSSGYTTPFYGLSPHPFNIGFKWGNKFVSIKLKNGEDVLKLADIFAKMLESNGIQYIIENLDEEENNGN